MTIDRAADGRRSFTRTRAIARAPDDVAAALDRSRIVVEACFPPDSPFVRRMADLRDRVSQQRLNLAVLGQFKRGKSTFINGLLGNSLLPTGVVPVTAVPIFIVWGKTPLIRVHYADGRGPLDFPADDAAAIHDALYRFVAEQANPENRLGVDRVVLAYPAPILAGGIVLIDTPGVGSSHQHNTDAAFRILPECDAALFLTSVDPPITETELHYLDRLRPHIGRLIFILNKVDHLGPEERDESLDFLRRTLERASLLPSDSAIFCVSARQGLAARKSHDPDAHAASGMAAVEAHLLHGLAAEKMRLLSAAALRKASSTLSEVAADIALRVRTLEMPLHELEARHAEFKEALVSIEEQRRTIGDLLAGERRRLAALLETRISDLRSDAKRSLNDVISHASEQAGSSVQDNPEHTILGPAIEGYFEQALAKISQEITERAEAALASHREKGNAMVDAVRRASAKIFAFPFAPATADDSFHHGKDPYWVTQDWTYGFTAGAEKALDRFLPKAVRRRRMKGRMKRQIDTFVVRNAENLRWSILRGIDETLQQATADFEAKLDEAIAATEGAVQAALDQRGRHAANIEPEIARLRRRSDLVTAAQEQLVQDARRFLAP